MANTSRPCSAAHLAVMIEPLCVLASTTKHPKLKPLIIRFLRGKFCGREGVPIANSEMTKPCSTIL
jgi:hypothetical protein